MGALILSNAKHLTPEGKKVLGFDLSHLGVFILHLAIGRLVELLEDLHHARGRLRNVQRWGLGFEIWG